MKLKTKTIDKTMSIDSQNNNPGPGNYENPESLSARGSYGVSKHRGTGATIFNPRKSQRFFQFSKYTFDLENLNPGPGQYNEINTLSDRGHYPLTKTNGFGKRFFDKETRVSHI